MSYPDAMPEPPDPVSEEHPPPSVAAREHAAASVLRLRTAAEAARVAHVRRAVSAFAEVLGVAPGVLADLRLALTEACANVVEHAYPAGAGVLEVQVEPD